MIISFTLRNGTRISARHWTDIRKNAEFATGSLAGSLQLLDPASGRVVQINARWMHSLRLVATQSLIELVLELPAPIPEHITGLPWKISIKFRQLAAAWELSLNIPWLQLSDPVEGRPGAWLYRNKPGNSKLLLKQDFPFDKLGLTQKNIQYFDAMRVGVFVVTNRLRSTLVLCCLPVPDKGSPSEPPYSYKVDAELALDGFRKEKINVESSMLRPSLSAHLEAGLQGSDGQGSPWFSSFQWMAYEDLGLENLFERLWNVLEEDCAYGLRNTSAGRPWWPVPHIQQTYWDRKKLSQRLTFSAPIRPGALPALKKLSHGETEASGGVKVKATYSWYRDETIPDQKLNPNADRVIQVSGGLDVKTKSLPGLPLNDDVGVATTIAEFINELVMEQPQTLISWKIAADTIDDSCQSWMNLGSVEILAAPAGKDNLIDIELSLSGVWNSNTCDIHAQMHMKGFPCTFRMSQGEDPSPESLVARFDVANRFEESLHKATPPVVSVIGNSPEGLNGSLDIRVKTENSRNAVIELNLRRQSVSDATGTEKSLFLQTRPFNFARLWSPEFDAEAGDDFGYWRSDDPEGPQWRIPDATVEFDLPPQTVAEEMERGQRFWPVAKSTDGSSKSVPYIDPTRPIRYRFSPPTHLRVRPSHVERRYNKNANNLTEILDKAVVESFHTELLYPLRMDFEIDDTGGPLVEINESGSYLGQPTAMLPTLQAGSTTDSARSFTQDIAQEVLPDDLAQWFCRNDRQAQDFEDFQSQYNEIRWTHSANCAQFSARLAQFHLHDPNLPGRQLALSQGLTARFRKPAEPRHREPGSMPPIMNPLPVGVALDQGQKNQLGEFLNQGNYGNPHDDGALRAGAFHTFEFASEILAVVRNTEAVSALIDTLSFSVIGATGSSAISFDEGRTIFSVEISDGQVWRLRKTRIGRIGILWNKAKHVIVYERSVIPSEQFQGQQPNNETYGWPLLRKAEEYIEPIEFLRNFADEPEGETNSAAFVQAAEFIMPRIYVDGAWGRDLGHGYEIPLWNPTDTSGFYPKPLVAVRTHAGAGEYTRAWFESPQELFFYTNTEAGEGADSDKWRAFHGVDLPAGCPTRLQLIGNKGAVPEKVLDSTRLPNPRIRGIRRSRFDLQVRSDGPVDLQYGRGKTEMLAAGIDVMTLARTQAVSEFVPTTDVAKNKLAEIAGLNDCAAKVDALRDEAAGFLRELPKFFLRLQLANCETLQSELEQRADELFNRMDAAASTGFDQIRKLQLNLDPKAALDKIKRDIFDWTLPIPATFGLPVAELRRLLLEASRYPDQQLDECREQLRQNLNDLYGGCDDILKVARHKLDIALVAPFREAQTELVALQGQIGSVAAEIDRMTKVTDAEFKAAAATALKAVDEAVAQLRRNKIPRFAEFLRKIETALLASRQLLNEASAVSDAGIRVFRQKTRDSLTTVITSIANLSDQLTVISGKITDDWLENIFSELSVQMNLLQVELEKNWDDVDTARRAIKDSLAVVGKGLDESSLVLEKELDKCRQALDAEFVTMAKALAGSIDELTGPVAGLCADLRNALQEVLDTHSVSAIFDEQKHAIKVLIEKVVEACRQGEAELNRLKDEITQEFDSLVSTVEQEVTGLVTSILDETTLQRMNDLSKDLEAWEDKAGKGLKLAKAIGSLPELPTLTFNADRVEYLFDDLKDQIDTSPFAVRMKEIDSGLKELGLAIPTRQILDSFLPDNIDVNINKIIRNVGLADLTPLFRKFRLPGLNSKQVQITHGIDKPSRTVWVKANLAIDHPKPEELFAAGPMAVRTASMSFRGNSDMRIGLDGKKSISTSGQMKADWMLDFKGAKLVNFRDVTLSHNGGKFDFNIKPEKVELHPSLKFISEIAKQLGEQLPPCIELVRDSRGVISGARANLTTSITDPPTWGNVKIGPLLMIGGLALNLEEGCKFAISGHMSVGTKAAPVFVQINLLGGGLWLECEARFIDGKITYFGNLGLALGSMESFNLAGIAKGSYSLLLFAYATFKPGGGSLRAGLRVQGSARILGIANAYVLILFEVTHTQSRSRGKGLLDLKIEIGRWYSKSIHRQVEKSL